MLYDLEFLLKFVYSEGATKLEKKHTFLNIFSLLRIYELYFCLPKMYKYSNFILRFYKNSLYVANNGLTLSYHQLYL